MYRRILQNAFSLFRPNSYLEIGVDSGNSLSFFSQFKDKTIIGIDPDLSHCRIKESNNLHLYEMTSDDFFKNNDITKNLSIEMAFIDGMHRFEYVLRDFANCEKYSNDKTVIFCHDVNPTSIATACRNIIPRAAWHGDVWKFNNILKEYRPDLDVTVFNIRDGLMMIKNLNNKSNILFDKYDEIFEKYVNLDFSNMYKGNYVQYYS